MLKIHSILRGANGFFSRITKKSYRDCLVITAGVVAVTTITFNSKSYESSAKSKVFAVNYASVVQTTDAAGEESNAEAKIQAGFAEIFAGTGVVADYLGKKYVSVSAENTNENPETTKVPSEVQTVAQGTVEMEGNTDQTADQAEAERDTAAAEEVSDAFSQISLSEKDYNTLLRIVEAEATGEDIKGKILVANVILNRVNDDRFPDDVTSVVYERCGGSAQFSPTADGRINTVSVTNETVEAVSRALSGVDYAEGALYFSARSMADPSNMNWFDRRLQWLFKYGGHEFYTTKR